ncbi:MAG: hypothetical protein QM765_26675 [Myxococcales bacterium]
MSSTAGSVVGPVLPPKATVGGAAQLQGQRLRLAPPAQFPCGR